MIISVDEMKEYLGIDPGDTGNDDFLEEQLELIQETVEAYCRRKFEQATYVETFYKEDNKPARKMTLFHFPVISVTSIVEDALTLAGSNYRLNKPTGTIRQPSGYFYYSTETIVTYVAGYANADIPKPIKSVIKSLVTERYNKKTSGVSLDFGSDVQRVSIPGTISIDFDYSLANNDRSSTFGVILGNYVNVLDYYRSNRSIIGSGKVTYVS